MLTCHGLNCITLAVCNCCCAVSLFTKFISYGDCPHPRCLNLLSCFKHSLLISILGCSLFVLYVDAQVLRSVLRQPVGHQESLCWVLHDGLQFHLPRGATCKTVSAVHQPHQWPVTLGKTWTKAHIGTIWVHETARTFMCNFLSVMKIGCLTPLFEWMFVFCTTVCILLFLILSYESSVYLTGNFVFSQYC